MKLEMKGEGGSEVREVSRGATTWVVQRAGHNLLAVHELSLFRRPGRTLSCDGVPAQLHLLVKLGST